MRRIARVVAAALAVAVSPQVARAEGPAPASIKVFCQPGSLNNCFAFAFQEADGHLTYWLQNLQGTVQPGGTGFAIQNFGIWSKWEGGISNPTRAVKYVEAQHGVRPPITAVEGNVVLGTSTGFSQDDAVYGLQRTYSRLGQGGLGIIGCTNPYAGGYDPDNFVAQTCPANGIDGWLRFDATAWVDGAFNAPLGPATFDDLYVWVQGCDVYVGARSGYTGRSDWNCATDLTYADIINGGPTTTVPEPGTLALFGTGLAGTLGVGSRSRRKRAWRRSLTARAPGL